MTTLPFGPEYYKQAATFDTLLKSIPDIDKEVNIVTRNLSRCIAYYKSGHNVKAAMIFDEVAKRIPNTNSWVRVLLQRANLPDTFPTNVSEALQGIDPDNPVITITKLYLATNSWNDFRVDVERRIRRHAEQQLQE